MIFPISPAKYMLLKIIYQESQIKISELLKKARVSQKAGYRYLDELLKSGIIKETLTGKKPILRVLSPNFKSEAGIAAFSLVETEKQEVFFKRHSKLKGPFEQFKREIAGIIEAALIFGSYARGAETEESDIDMLLITRNKVTKANKAKIDQIYEYCFITLENKVSTRLLSSSEFIELKNRDELIKGVIKDHICIYRADNFLRLIN